MADCTKAYKTPDGKVLLSRAWFYAAGIAYFSLCLVGAFGLKLIQDQSKAFHNDSIAKDYNTCTSGNDVRMGIRYLFDQLNADNIRGISSPQYAALPQSVKDYLILLGQPPSPEDLAKIQNAFSKLQVRDCPKIAKSGNIRPTTSTTLHG